MNSEHSLGLHCELSYDAEIPLAVALAFDAGGERPVRWVLDRQLLADGLTTLVGDGEVALWPMPDSGTGRSSFCLRVGERDRAALFEIPAEPVVRWLASTWNLVPRGTEPDGVRWEELVQMAE
ncbi:SsgA family sporulation/cell division regulator [Streptomyces sp. NPDC005498]|uniref:SsgA family sporulation/cell division regulator n=1 Tax=Streptomyces sp. NPDC005498 TaxID=3364717 RepID=UPI0036D034D3